MAWNETIKSLDVARDSKSFEKEFNDFLGKTLIPTFSSNNSTSRTDILIQQTILDSHPNALTILDVCSGRPLLLEKLIEEIGLWDVTKTLRMDHSRECGRS
jgi:hypothetical protein